MAGKVITTCESAVPSKWLREALSDVEMKASAIRAILEDDFANGKSDEIVYAREGEIVELLNEMKRSYTSLARDHDRLTTKFIGLENASKEKQPSNDSDPDPDHGSDSSPVSGIEDLEIENFDIDPFLGLKSSTGEIEEEAWSLDEMTARVTELVEESGKKQEELARRNEEKREIIQGLRTEVNGLKAENKALQDCLVGPKVGSEIVHGGNQLRKASSLTGLVWNRIFRSRLKDLAK